MRRTAALCFFASILLTSSALASGFGLRDTSGATLGSSYAGNAANGEYASTLAFNPALLGDVDSFDMSASGVGLLPDTKGTFTATTSAGTPVPGLATPKGIVNTALIPSLSLRYRLSPQFVVGLTTTSPWGMITNYGNTSVTRYYNTYSDVKTFNAMPMIAWQPVPQLSIGVAMQIEYIKGRLAKAIDFGTIGALNHFPGSIPGADDGFVLLKAQDWSYGWVLGVEWKPTDSLSLGVSYRSQINNTLKGTENFTLDPGGVGAYLKAHTTMFTDGAASAKITTPSILTFGVKYKMDDQWTLLAGADYTGWDKFQSLIAHSSNPVQPDDVSMMSWQNSWFGSVGVEYKPVQDWTLRLGAAYDQTPTTTGRRTPGIPDGGRYWISGGVGFAATKNIDLNLSLAYLQAEKANIALRQTDTGNALRGNLTGTVNMSVVLVGFEADYHL